MITKTKNCTFLYVAKSFRADGKCTSKIVEKLGTFDELKKVHDDPISWGKEYAKKLTLDAKEKNADILIKYSPAKTVGKGLPKSFNGGYLFLQKIYTELGLKNICEELSPKYKFDFDLDAILSRLIYSRIIHPSSKLATLEFSRKFIEPPNFDLQQIYRALVIISKENDFIQSQLYLNSLKISKRNAGILYFDCTNYFFEIDVPSGLKQYGYSKEHRQSPIVQMGLFMDADGIPLAFNIFAGNESEQNHLQPLEKKIFSDFKLAKLVVCTDAGLSSYSNREFNNFLNRSFVTIQPLKKLAGHLIDWALEPSGWRDLDTDKICEIEDNLDEKTVLYKEKWINENNLSQRLIVTYSPKYKNYKQKVRTATKKDAEDEKYDGFYGTCTNLNDPVAEIVKINHRRWEVEECFRIMKSEFKARPVFLVRDDRIKAHFMTCFIALLVYRLLEKKLEYKFTCREIIDGLRDMNFHKVHGEGYLPTYTRTDFTDALHEKFGFRTDYEIVTMQKMKENTTFTKVVES